MFAHYATKVSRTVSKAVPSVATLSSISPNATKVGSGASSASVMKPVGKGNSFSSFKQYREIAKTYGPLSAKLATKRQLAYPNGVGH